MTVCWHVLELLLENRLHNPIPNDTQVCAFRQKVHLMKPGTAHIFAWQNECRRQKQQLNASANNQFSSCHSPAVTFVTASRIGLAPTRSRTRLRKLPLKSTISTCMPPSVNQDYFVSIPTGNAAFNSQPNQRTELTAYQVHYESFAVAQLTKL